MALGRSVEAKYALTKELAEQKYINNKEVNDRRRNISGINNKFKKVKTISEIDPLQSLPVVIRILLDIQSRLPQEDPNFSETCETVASAINIFYEVDILQNTRSINAIKQYFEDRKITRETIKPFVKNLLQGLIDSIQTVAIDGECKDLWAESASWLDGLFHRTYDQMPKDENGEPKKDKNGDYEYIGPWGVGLDFIFKKATGGLTKMAISYYYGEATKLIESKIAEYEAQLEQVPVDDAVAVVLLHDDLPPVDVLNESGKGKEEAVPQDEKVHIAAAEAKQIEAQYYEGTIRNSLCIKPTAGNTLTLELTVGRKHGAILKEVAETVDELLNNPLLSDLRACMDKEAVVRLQNFETSLNKHGLSRRQVVKLAKLADLVASQLTGYTDTTRLRNFLGDYIPFIGTTHRAEVKKTLDKISGLEDPVEQLKELFKLKAYLKKEKSVEMLPVVRNILFVQMERLCPRIPSNLLDYSSVQRALEKEWGIDFSEVRLHEEGEDLEPGFEKYKVTMRADGDKTLLLGLSVNAKDEQILREVEIVIRDMMSNPLAYELRSDSLSSLDARLANFESALKKYKLNGAQESELSNLGAVAINELSGYLGSSYIRPTLGMISASLDLVHRKTIEDAIDFMRQVTNPYEQLIELFELRTKLGTESSRTALPIVTELLRVQMERLCTRSQYSHAQHFANLSAQNLHQVADLTRQESSSALILGK